MSELQLVDKETGDVITLPAIATGVAGVPAETLDIRSNSKDNPFFSLASMNRGGTIFLNILNSRGITAQPEGFDNPAYFYQIIANTSFSEDATPFIACITLSGVAADKMKETLNSVAAVDGGTLKYIFKLTLKKTASTSKRSYSDFDLEKREATKDELGQFMAVIQVVPALISDFKTIPNEQ